MVDFNIPTTDAPGLPPARFTISFTGTCSSGTALARARYKVLHPVVFFLESGIPTSEVFKKGIQLTPAGVPVDHPVEVRSTAPAIAYFIEVRLEEIDVAGNVVSSKTRVMTIQ